MKTRCVEVRYLEAQKRLKLHAKRKNTKIIESKWSVSNWIELNSKKKLISFEKNSFQPLRGKFRQHWQRMKKTKRKWTELQWSWKIKIKNRFIAHHSSVTWCQNWCGCAKRVHTVCGIVNFIVVVFYGFFFFFFFPIFSVSIHTEIDLYDRPQLLWLEAQLPNALIHVNLETKPVNSIKTAPIAQCRPTPRASHKRLPLVMPWNSALAMQTADLVPILCVDDGRQQPLLRQPHDDSNAAQMP